MHPARAGAPLVAAAGQASVAAMTAWLRGPGPGPAFAVGCLSGPPGVGKMTVLRALAPDVPCHLLMLTPDRYPTTAECLDQIVKWCTTQAFEDAFAEADGNAEAEPPARVIVLDALDVFMSTERTLLSTLATRFKAADVPRWRPLRFLVVAPTAYERRVHEAFRGCAKFALPAPTAAEAAAYLALPPTARAAAEVAQTGNVAFAVACLARGDTQTRKDADVGLPAHCLWTRPLSRDTARAIVAQDTVFHPLRFHENVLAEILRRRATVRERKAVALRILRHMVAWDQLAAAAANNHLADEIAAEHAAGLPALLAPLPPAARKAPLDAAFTKMLSNLSVQKKVMRRDAALSKTHAFFPMEHVGSYHAAA